MWVKIKDNITTNLWYKDHMGEIFEVYVTPWVDTDNNDIKPIYAVESDDDILLIGSNDVDIVEPRREKLIKLKNKL